MKINYTYITLRFCLSLLILMMNLQSYAQTDPLRLKLDSIFEYVDKSQIPTGFLEEYGAEFANLKTYNGVLTDSNVVNAMAWHYIYASIYSGNIYGTNTLPTPENNYSIFNNVAVANPNINPVTIMALNYSSIKSYAVDNNLLSVSNSRFYDVTGRPESPYQLNTVFAAAPFYETDNDGGLSLLFKQNLFINTTGKTVSNIQVDFNNGNGFVTANWDNPISYTYTDTGSKRLTFKLNFTDATNFQCYSTVNIIQVSGGSFRYQPTTATTPFNPTNNNHRGGDITVQYSVNNTSPTNNRKFQKPFIVVEGFDMHDAAPLLMPDGYDYIDFLDEINLVNFNSNSFNHNLDNIGSYDLIFLNYRDGTDDILRNALLLEEVINWVNNNKDAGALQNVVMGISMGGLVSRYCLAKMTKENHNPQTRLLITHDSPHRGANIPLGMQYLLNDFANKNILGRQLQDWIPLLKQAVILQLRPATMQQLIVRDNPSTRALEYNTFLANGGLYRQMVTFGPSDPQPAYRFIATSQGSQCGIPVMPPSTLIAQASGFVKYGFIAHAFSTKFSGEVSVNALPNGTASQRITYFKLQQKNRFLWIPFTQTLMHFEHYSPSGILGYDGAPAGTQPLSRGTGVGNMPPSYFSFGNLFVFQIVANFDGLQLQPDFSFVPTVSALDEDNITATSLYAPHVGALYAPPGNANALQGYVAQELTTINGIQKNNISHTDFTARNARWMYNEMETISQPTTNCEDYCTGYTISGPANLCSSSVYSVEGLVPGSTITWSASAPSRVQFSCATCAQTTITRLYSGVITLTATITSNCPPFSITLTKAVTVGAPDQNSLYGIFSTEGYSNYLQDFNCLKTYTFPGMYSGDISLTDPITTSFTWTFVSKYPSTATVSIGGSTDGRNMTVTVKPQGAKVVYRLTRTNSCGSHSHDYTFIANGFCAIEDQGMLVQEENLRLAPNPSTGTFNVLLQSNDRNKGIKMIVIRNKFGAEMKRMAYNGSSKALNINIQNLPMDVYSVEVFDGTKWRVEKIIKQ